MRGQIRRCYRIGFVVCCAISILWIHPMTKRIRTEYQDWDEGIRKNIYCLFACVRTSWNQPKFQKATGLMQSNNPYDKFFLQGFGLTCFFSPGLLVQFLPSIVRLTRHPTFFENYCTNLMMLVADHQAHWLSRRSSTHCVFLYKLFMLASDISKYPM